MSFRNSGSLMHWQCLRMIKSCYSRLVMPSVKSITNFNVYHLKDALSPSSCKRMDLLQAASLTSNCKPIMLTPHDHLRVCDKHEDHGKADLTNMIRMSTTSDVSVPTWTCLLINLFVTMPLSQYSSIGRPRGLPDNWWFIFCDRILAIFMAYGNMCVQRLRLQNSAMRRMHGRCGAYSHYD